LMGRRFSDLPEYRRCRYDHESAEERPQEYLI
jgi:hypothetical protein